MVFFFSSFLFSGCGENRKGNLVAIFEFWVWFLLWVIFFCFNLVIIQDFVLILLLFLLLIEIEQFSRWLQQLIVTLDYLINVFLLAVAGGKIENILPLARAR